MVTTVLDESLFAMETTVPPCTVHPENRYPEFGVATISTVSPSRYLPEPETVPPIVAPRVRVL
jgi:hypothetical protein